MGMSPETLLALRTLAGMSQSRLAASLGVHRVTVTRWETGAVPIPQWVELALPRLVDAITAAS